MSDLDKFMDYVKEIAEMGSMEEAPADDANARKIANVYSVINQQVADVGLKVSRIYISRALSQKEIDDQRIAEEEKKAHEQAKIELERANELKKAALENEMKTADAKAKHDRDVQVHRRVEEIIETEHLEEKERVKLLSKVQNRKSKRGTQIQMDAIEEAIKRVAGNVNTASDFSVALDEITQAFLSASNTNGSPSFEPAGRGELSSPNVKLLSARLENNSLAELVGLATEIIELLNNTKIPQDKVLSTMSEVLHLLGELILGDNAIAENIEERHRLVVKKFSAIRQFLKLKHPGDLNDLIDLEALKKRFSVT